MVGPIPQPQALSHRPPSQVQAPSQPKASRPSRTLQALRHQMDPATAQAPAAPQLTAPRPPTAPLAAWAEAGAEAEGGAEAGAGGPQVL